LEFLLQSTIWSTTQGWCGFAERRVVCLQEKTIPCEASSVSAELDARNEQVRALAAFCDPASLLPCTSSEEVGCKYPNWGRKFKNRPRVHGHDCLPSNLPQLKIRDQTRSFLLTALIR
jgi:hypothetical protein